MTRAPPPPFTREFAIGKVRLAEHAWNTRDPKVAAAYTPDSRWRNRSEIFEGRDAIVAFLRRKWECEHDYRLVRELWALDESGYMRRREASVNDIPIRESDRRILWPLGIPKVESDAPGQRAILLPPDM